MVRRATADDLPTLFEAGLAFYKVSNLPMKVDPESLYNSLADLLESPTCIILTTGNGSFVGGVSVVSWLDSSATVLQEIFWWAKPGEGMSLLEAFENAAVELGVSYVTMAALDSLRGPVLQRLYERRGYNKMETTFIKAII